jgi:hypothetical protein
MKISVTYINADNEKSTAQFSDNWAANPHADAINHGIRWDLKIVSFDEVK